MSFESMNKFVLRNLITTAAITVGGTYAVKYFMKKSRTRGKTKVKLLPNESSPIIRAAPSMSTITFFTGSSSQASTHLSAKVASILLSNPWIDCTLEEEGGGGLALYHPKTPSNVESFFQVRDDINLPEDLTDGSKYVELVNALQPVLCPPTESSIGVKKHLFKCTLIPQTSTTFAIVVSANHSIMDGQGYYRLYNMLCKDANVEPLNPVRDFESADKILAVTGGVRSLLAATPPGFLLRFVWGTIKNVIKKETTSVGFIVDKNYIKDVKGKVRGVEYVSTNDILVSTFCNLLNCKVGMMQMNFRGRIKGPTMDDVGNYEDLIEYTDADYNTPELIRESVKGPIFHRKGGGVMLNNMEHLMEGTYGLITSWATFAKTISLPGGEQNLHLPIFDWNKSTPASVCGAMCIFRPRDGEIGVIAGGLKGFIEKLGRDKIVGERLY